MFKGFRLNELIEYIKKHKFDIITLQEVSKGLVSHGGVDCYKSLVETLDMQSELVTDFRPQNDPEGFMGNATFYNKNLKLVNTNKIHLRPFAEVDLSNPDYTMVPRSALAVKFSYEGKEFEVINTHGAWSLKAVDTPEKIRQATILYNYLKTVNLPFILAGDFNMTSGTKVIQMYLTLARDLSEEYDVKNTINLDVHYAKEQLKDGITVDHVFVTSDIKVHNFEVVATPTLSDHYGLRAELEI